jgi:hypothetical protein
VGENGVAPHETCHERQLLAPPVTRGADRVMCSGWDSRICWARSAVQRAMVPLSEGRHPR